MIVSDLGRRGTGCVLPEHRADAVGSDGEAGIPVACNDRERIAYAGCRNVDTGPLAARILAKRCELVGHHSEQRSSACRRVVRYLARDVHSKGGQSDQDGRLELHDVACRLKEG